MTLVGPQLKSGDKAPDFKVANSAASTLTLGRDARARPGCSASSRRSTRRCAAFRPRRSIASSPQLGDKVASYTVSLDTPFAQKRFCTDADVKNMQTLSDQHDQSFGQNYGVLLEGLAVPLLARAVFVVDKGGKITHVEYVAEVTHEPNYDAAMKALKAVA